MKTKTVWQCDENGYLIGRTVADESPLEPGHFLIPAGAVAVKPPYAASGRREWRWDGHQWQEVPTRPAVPVPTAEERLAAFLRANPDIRDMMAGR